MSSVAAMPVSAARPSTVSRLHVLRVLNVAAQVGLALLVVRAFQLESRTFFNVALLAAAGFLPHAFLPARWRLPAFVALSAACLVIAVGPRGSLWLLATGTVLVGICHLPVRPAARIALLLAAGAGLAAARAGLLPVPRRDALWAVLGSVFMFRLALYVHALRHDPVKPTPAQTAAYFLMLPNPVFPLFPVVDFSAFVRSHYAGDAADSYQTGVTWIARGLVHLLLYRVVYHYLPADPLALASVGGLAWYLLGTFLLYLRVSGQFHLIVGMLRLYGFALPETHRLFFLSSSFTDFWRRINIYWKDFMMKLVYYPSFFRLRRWGGTVALVVSTIAVFVLTWFLHAYQWFWILGSFLLSVPDVLFWTILGALVVATSLREAKRGRDRSLGARRWSVRLAAQTVATFCALCVLWSLWSAESVFEWVAMWRAGGRGEAWEVATIAALFAAGFAVAGRNWIAPPMLRETTPSLWNRADVRTALTLVALLALAQPAVANRLGPAAPLAASLRATTLSARDQAMERRGYYERLDHAPRLGAQGWEPRLGPPTWWQGFPTIEAYQPRKDFRLWALAPNTRDTYLRHMMTTNAWGMRDAPRALAKAPGTVRLAFLGPSITMGSGVGDRDAYPAQLERRLNADAAQTAVRYEALNFGVPAYSLLQQYLTLEQDAFRFNPDVAVLTIYGGLRDPAATQVSRGVARGYPAPHPALDSLFRARLVRAWLPREERMGAARLVADDVHAWTLRRMAAECRRRGIVPVALVLDVVGNSVREPHARRVAQEAGFVVLDLSDVYGDPAGHGALRLGDWDRHPNVAGHARIAARLEAELRRRPDLLTPHAADVPHGADVPNAAGAPPPAHPAPAAPEARP